MSLKLHRPKKCSLSFKKTGGLGLKLDYKETSVGAVINEVHATGLIATWNSEHKGSELVKGDRIVEFDEKVCRGMELLGYIKSQEHLKLTALKY